MFENGPIFVFLTTDNRSVGSTSVSVSNKQIWIFIKESVFRNKLDLLDCAVLSQVDSLNW